MPEYFSLNLHFCFQCIVTHKRKNIYKSRKLYCYGNGVENCFFVWEIV